MSERAPGGWAERKSGKNRTLSYSQPHIESQQRQRRKTRERSGNSQFSIKIYSGRIIHAIKTPSEKESENRPVLLSIKPKLRSRDAVPGELDRRKRRTRIPTIFLSRSRDRSFGEPNAAGRMLLRLIQLNGEWKMICLSIRTNFSSEWVSGYPSLIFIWWRWSRRTRHTLPSVCLHNYRRPGQKWRSAADWAGAAPTPSPALSVCGPDALSPFEPYLSCARSILSARPWQFC